MYIYIYTCTKWTHHVGLFDSLAAISLLNRNILVFLTKPVTNHLVHHQVSLTSRESIVALIWLSSACKHSHFHGTDSCPLLSSRLSVFSLFCFIYYRQKKRESKSINWVWLRLCKSLGALLASLFLLSPLHQRGTLVNQITVKSFNRVPSGTCEIVETSKTDIMPPLNLFGWFPLGWDLQKIDRSDRERLVHKGGEHKPAGRKKWMRWDKFPPTQVNQFKRNIWTLSGKIWLKLTTWSCLWLDGSMCVHSLNSSTNLIQLELTTVLMFVLDYMKKKIISWWIFGKKEPHL